MWKQAKESGVSLAELLVVLAITVVLAAILLPALSTPTQAGNGEVALDPYVVADGQWGAVTRNRAHRDDRPEVEEPIVENGPAIEETVEVMPAFNSGEVETLERDGLKKIKTTDISYTLP